MNILHPDGQICEIDQPFTDLACLDADSTRALLIASNSYNEAGLLEVDLNTLNWKHTPSRQSPINKEEISLSDSIYFNGFSLEYSSLKAIKPGISLSAIEISFLPKSA